jgi:hypothetical protein
VATVVDPCVPVDAQQFGKLLSIELGTSIDYRATGSDTPGLTQVALSCTEQGIELRLQDGASSLRRARAFWRSRWPSSSWRAGSSCASPTNLRSSPSGLRPIRWLVPSRRGSWAVG